jgi:NAD(P)-dependent dehydrogenase (short-subunit alcohol dehydrogenase family)
MFIRSVNTEYASVPEPRTLRAVALAPGVVDTGMQETIRGADFAQVQRFRDLKDNEQLARRRYRPAHRGLSGPPDFGTTELDDIRKY